MNVSWSRKIFAQLHACGVQDVIFCAGARNGSLIAVLSKLREFRKHSFFEERSAGFYALGIARRTLRPVAVITTSGTAVAELLPAVIEAYHTGVPLILITADRPKRLRGTGAPQSIDQTGIFAKFIDREFDLEKGEMFDLSDWTQRSPVHLNVCFDEPLLDEPVSDEPIAHEPVIGRTDVEKPAIRGPLIDRTAVDQLGVEKATSAAEVGNGVQKPRPGFHLPIADAVTNLQSFIERPGQLLVVVGTLETDVERMQVTRFLAKLGAPVYVESTSGLREMRSSTNDIYSGHLRHNLLRSGDRVLQWALKRRLFQKVLRIGGVPTVRIWRDLEEPSTPVQTLSLTSLPFSGLSRGEMACADIAEVLARISGKMAGPESSPESRPESRQSLQSADVEALLTKDREAASELIRLLDSEPRSEPALVRALSKLVPMGSLMYVGNSLPIREWDLAADFERPFAVEANRGVNGIDGQVSTFLGIAREGIENWALIGDLTALYDLPGPWALECRPEINARIVVMNNGGGKIFNRIFRNPLFENRHSLSFGSWAELWGLKYERWEQVPSQAPQGDALIIEIVPDDEATQRFWDQYDRLWIEK